MVEITVEVDDAHEFMTQKMLSDEVTLEEYIQNVVDRGVYQDYQAWKKGDNDEPTP